MKRQGMANTDWPNKSQEEKTHWMLVKYKNISSRFCPSNFCYESIIRSKTINDRPRRNVEELRKQKRGFQRAHFHTYRGFILIFLII